METFPSSEIIETLRQATPDYMYPSDNPWVVIFEGRLQPEACDHLVSRLMSVDAYRFPNCAAETREMPRPLHYMFNPIINAIVEANNRFWQYELGQEPGAWLQTYEEGDSYQMHMDSAAGQTRKLTGIALLSDPEDYSGGDLVFHIPPHVFDVPKTRGTVVVFPHWVQHEVYEVISGLRQTINLGFWGPPFR